MQLIPINTATHTATQSGSWFDASTWQENSIPDDAAIVVIPAGVTVTYEGSSEAHLFAVRVDGTFKCEQTNTASTSKIIFDTFIGTMTSLIQFHADAASDGNIQAIIKPFDIEAHKAGTSGYSQVWSSAANDRFSDEADHYQVTYDIGPDYRFKTYADAEDGNTTVTESSRNLVSDGPGVLGRYEWDTTQLSLGLTTMGQIEIIGQEKTVMAKLSQDALKNDTEIQLESTPDGWKNGDLILVTKGGNKDASSNATETVILNTVGTNELQLATGLNKNHEGRMVDDLHCYVGNLNRNITFSSFNPNEITHRGHFMVMHNPSNIQVKNAAFNDMGRTDKGRLTDDLIWSEWVEPPTFTSYVSPLGQLCSQLVAPPAQDITNSRGRYSIHLHRVGAVHGSNMAQITGNVVNGNPGWAITHHDSHANVSNNVVYDVIGSGIVSEAGNETGFWDNNLVVDIKKGDNTDDYVGSIFYDHYLYSGQGLGMKGRGVVCRGNVIADANVGVGIVNFNAAINNTLKMDSDALAARLDIDQFPLSKNGMSKEGDGIMPLEVALILKNTTVIWVNMGLSSIERDMGVNHESRSVFDNFKVWGASTGVRITYQNDYSFRDLFISGKKEDAIGLYMWKHSHNQSFERVKFADLKYAITVSKLVESGNGKLKTRNNGVTPWLFVDVEKDNVENLYGIHTDDPNSTLTYDEHPDNTIHLSSTHFSRTRPVTFTINQQADLEIDVAAGDLKFMVDGVVTDRIGAYEFGVEQSITQENLRTDYPQRIYEFADQTKLEAYLTAHGVYQDPNDNGQLYFIIDEYVPDRITYEYKKCPVRIKINNVPATAVYSNPLTEPTANFYPQLELISRAATANQSSDSDTISFSGVNILAPAEKAIDGNCNGRKIAQFYQQDLLPIGSAAVTKEENEPWWEMDLGEEKIIEYIDVWNTVQMNGSQLEIPSAHFHDFYVLISNQPFGNVDLSTARANATQEFFKNQEVTRVFSINDINAVGRYIRIQASGSTIVGLAEVDVLGRSLTVTPDCNGVSNGLAYIDNCGDCVMGNTGETPCSLNEEYIWTKSDSPNLPVELIEFTAKLVDNNALIEWSTALEENVLNFEIQRSPNAIHWEKLKTVAAKNKPSNYEDWDFHPFLGNTYYRLKISDLDGSFDYSDSALVFLDQTDDILLYPNPSSGVFSVQMDVPNATNIDFQIINPLGQILETKSVEAQMGDRINCPFNLKGFPPGTYFLQYKDAGQSQAVPFVIE